MNLQTGAFGDPASVETLILFWGKMEELHYPGAAATKAYLEERMEREQQMRQMQQMQMQQQGAPRMPEAGPGEAALMDGGLPAQTVMGIERQAREDAMRAVRAHG